MRSGEEGLAEAKAGVDAAKAKAKAAVEEAARLEKEIKVRPRGNAAQGVRVSLPSASHCDVPRHIRMPVHFKCRNPLLHLTPLSCISPPLLRVSSSSAKSATLA